MSSVHVKMVFEQIERLKRDYTDKYVEVDGNRPELSRFRGMTGVVKTVNMNGRALVQFDANANIGWFDIGLDFLKVVDAPQPKPVEVKEKAPAPKRAAPEAKAAPAAKPAESGKRSTADILAAARAKAGEATKPATESAAKPGGKLSTADILAAARAKAAAGAGAEAKASPAKPKVPEKASPAKAEKRSTAEVLAAARGKTAPATQEVPAADPETPVKTKPKPTSKPVPAAAVETSKPAVTAKSKPAGNLPKTTAEKIAYCQRVDART